MSSLALHVVECTLYRVFRIPLFDNKKTCAEEFVSAGIRIPDEWLKRAICMIVLRSGADLGHRRTTDYATVLFPLPGISNDLEVVRLL